MWVIDRWMIGIKETKRVGCPAGGDSGKSSDLRVDGVRNFRYMNAYGAVSAWMLWLMNRTCTQQTSLGAGVSLDDRYSAPPAAPNMQ